MPFAEKGMGIALIGAGLELEAVGAVEDENARAFSLSIGGIPGQGDAAFVSVDTELFRRSGASRIAHRKQRKACDSRPSIDRTHQGSHSDREKRGAG
jgi:hypothetical protein